MTVSSSAGRVGFEYCTAYAASKFGVQQVSLGGLDASRVALGTMAMSGYYLDPDSSDAESIRTIHRALDLGLTHVDTAEIYGPYVDEKLVGRPLKDRHDAVVAVRSSGWSRTAPAWLLAPGDAVAPIPGTKRILPRRGEHRCRSRSRIRVRCGVTGAARRRRPDARRAADQVLRSREATSSRRSPGTRRWP